MRPALRAARNIAKAFLLLGGFVALLTALGWWLGAIPLASLFFVATLLMAATLHWYGPRIVLASLGARELTLAEAPRLAATVERLAIAAARRAAEALSPPGRPPARAVGRPRRLGVGDRSLERARSRSCSPAELEGVLAHELAHARYRDVTLVTPIVVIAGWLIEVSRVGGFLERWLLARARPGRREHRPPLPVDAARVRRRRVRGAGVRVAARSRGRARPARAGAGAAARSAPRPTTEPVYTIDPFADEGLARALLHPSARRRPRGAPARPRPGVARPPTGGLGARRADACSTTSAAVAQPRRAVATASHMFPSPAVECASVLTTIRAPDSIASRTCSSRRSSRAGSPFTSSTTPVSSATAIVSSMSSAFGGRRPISRPVGWLSARTAGWRIASVTRFVSSRAGHPLARVDAGGDPVELVQDVVGQIQRAVGKDVALDAAQDPERRERLVGRGDLLALAAHVVGGQAGHDADARRVVADGDVLVAERRAPRSRARAPLALPSDQVVWQWRSPRTSAISMSARRLTAERLLRGARAEGREPRGRRRRPPLGAAFGERLELRPRTPASRWRGRAPSRSRPAGRASARPARRRGLRRPRPLARARRLRRPRRSPRSVRSTAPGSSTADDDRESSRSVDRAAHVTGNLASDRPRRSARGAPVPG